MTKLFKKTKIGNIPFDWQVIKQSKVATFYNGRAYQRKEWEDSGVPVIRLQNLTGTGKNYYFSNLNLPHHQYCHHGDLLYMWSATFGPVWWRGEKAIFHYHIWKVEQDCSVLNKVFHYYLLSDITERMLKKSNGSTMLHLTKKSMEEALVPLPLLSEQVKIGKALSTIDEKIESITKQLKTTEELKKGLMQILFTKGIGHTRFKDSKLGKIPRSWEVVDLGNLGVFSKGKGISKKDLVKEGIACVRYGEIYTKHNFVIKRPYSFINEETAKSSVMLKNHDVLFAGSGETLEDIGKAVVFLGEEETYAGGDIIIFSPNQQFNSIFLSYCLNSTIAIKQRRKFGQGNSVVHIYAKNLGVMKLPKPSKEEQNKIATVFSMIDSKKDILLKKREQYLLLKKGLMQQLLTGKMRLNHGN